MSVKRIEEIIAHLIMTEQNIDVWEEYQTNVIRNFNSINFCKVAIEVTKRQFSDFAFLSITFQFVVNIKKVSIRNLFKIKHAHLVCISVYSIFNFVSSFLLLFSVHLECHIYVNLLYF